MMKMLNNHIREYQSQLSKGQIQKAYRGIMAFMSGLSKYLASNYSEYAVSALYPGYMDMTYFAFTPNDLRVKKLKVAIVYLHEKDQFEVWLAGNNRTIQAEYIALISRKNIGRHKLSQAQPGVDSIIESILVKKPDFDHPEELKEQIERMTLQFIKEMSLLLNDQ